MVLYRNGKLLKELNLCPVIECDTLTDNKWVDSFWKNRRYNDDDLSRSIGWVTSLRPVRVRAPVDPSIVPVLECLVLLQLSDRYNVLIFHTFSIKDSYCIGKL